MTRKALAEQIKKTLRRSRRGHSFTHARVLEKIWTDPPTREVELYAFAWKSGFALAWYNFAIGAIFVGRGTYRDVAIPRPKQTKRARENRRKFYKSLAP